MLTATRQMSGPPARLREIDYFGVKGINVYEPNCSANLQHHNRMSQALADMQNK